MWNIQSEGVRVSNIVVDRQSKTVTYSVLPVCKQINNCESAKSGKGLDNGALGMVGSTVMGLSSTAPLYSLAATLGWVVIAIGPQAPVAFIAAAIPMVFSALAYQELNREMPDCGSTFVWGTKAFGPVVGWIGGWAVAVSAIMCMANVAEISGRYMWKIFGYESFARNHLIVTITGSLFILVMTIISYIGTQLGKRLQVVIMTIQLGALVLFGMLSIWHAIGAKHVASVPFDWQWFNPLAVNDLSGFTHAVLLCLFIYWGWDACLSLNEETKNPNKTPGRAALTCIALLIVLYVGVSVAVMMLAGFGTDGYGIRNPNNLDDVFSVLGREIFGPWGWFLLFAIMISAASSSQTTILPTARGALSMAVYKAIPESFAQIHPRFKTPSFSTVVMGIVSILFYVVMSMISGAILADWLTSMGIAIAFYYAITSFSCVWYFRKTLLISVRNFFFRGVMPFIGGLFLGLAFIQSAVDMLSPEYSETMLLGIGGAFVLGVGALLAGGVLMFLWWIRPEGKDFFAGKSLNVDTPILVPEE